MNFRRNKFRILLPLLYVLSAALPVVGLIITIAEGPNPFGFLFPLSAPGFYLLDALDRFLPVPTVMVGSLCLLVRL
jgi:cytochrome b561